MKRLKTFSGILRISAIVFLMVMTSVSFAQDKAESLQYVGKVLDIDGLPVPGATVSLKSDPTKGASTNVDGEYVLTATPSDVFIFSCIGYETIEVEASKHQKIVIMKPNQEFLDEVVVVGYGTQKKVSVVGAVSTIDVKAIRSVPAPSISQALVGKVPGLVSRQVSGEPGQDQAFLYIRGMSTWGDNTPIVIVDGIERDLNSLNTAEIETITFLKDATATSIYGIRGANGVVIITTRRGDVGAPKVSLRSEFACLSGMRFPDFINSGEYAELWNEARINDGLEPTYTGEEILKYYTGSDPYNYPDIDWMDHIFKKHTFQTVHNLNINGGTEKVRYFVNLGFTMQDGLFKRDPSFEYNTNVNMYRYNLRANVDVQLAPSLVAEVGLGYISKDQTHPGYYTPEILGAAFDYAPNKIPMRNPDGTFSASIFNQYTNPYMQATHGGYMTQLSYNLQGTFTLKWDLSNLVTKGLNWTNTFSFDQSGYGWNRRLKGVNSKEYLGLSSSGEENYKVWFEKAPEIYSTSAASSRALRFFSQLNYNRSFGNHNVNGMLMFNIAESVNQLAGNGTAALPSRMMGLSGRAVYDYDSRYIAEFSFGYNGSENFAPGHRFGFFPGVAIGWNIAKEPFWKVDKFSTFKLRGSVGMVGNDRTGGTRYSYLSTTASATGFLMGQYMNPTAGYSENIIGGGSDVTWEEATKFNAGLELGFFEDKVTFNVDVFKEKRNGLLVQRKLSVPQASGFQPWQLPYVNIGKTENKGIEAMLEAKNTTSSGLFYSFKGNFSFSRSLCIDRDEPANQPEYQSYRGHSLGLTSALIALGFFESQEDIDTSPRQDFGPVQPGDIKYRDVNGDGIINNNDKVLLGHPQVPEINYGFGVTLAYKGFDLSIYFTGAANSSYFFYGSTIYPFQWGQEGNIQREFYEYRWRPGADNSNAKYPRVSSSENTNNNRLSTLYMRDNSYLRLKNAEIGYTLPSRWLKAMRMDNFRIFINGIDLLLFDKLKIVDPEADNGNVAVYPKQRTINAGLDITF